jgi:hypothetical protein
MRRAFLIALASLVLAGCTPTSTTPTPNPPSSDVLITLERTPCYGFCPDYTLSINGAGDVTYSGRRFVNVVGAQRATIPVADVQALLARFDSIGFERLRDEYRAQVTDLPTTTITLRRNGRTKSVLDYGGTGAGMPESVRALQDEIDRVANSARWVLRDGQPVGR